MTLDELEFVIGEIRGYRWWQVTPRGWLRSPWHGRGRWDVGDNVALCVRADHWRQLPFYPHREGTPSIDCACGFYALHDIPMTSPEQVRYVWEMAATNSGRRRGLVFGVAGGHGHMLIGTSGWRAEVARVRALYMGREGREGKSTQRLNVAIRRYDVPLYADLDALVAEWGPERETVVDQGPDDASFRDRMDLGV
jgi:hypothetical protein